MSTLPAQNASVWLTWVCRHAYTGGSEGLVRLWSMKEGDSEEPEVATEGNEGITCLAAGVRL